LVKKGYAYRLSMTFSESTRFKMKVAHAIFAIMRFLNIREERVIYRGGLKFEVDISEGIDLSLFLFGHFQNHVSRNKFISLPKDAVIFDVGANFGSISLPFATGHDRAVVYAFEPTHSAMAKLKRNIELNVDILGRRVIPIQAFISDSNTNSSTLAAFSSWPVDSLDGDRHPVHLGVSKDATKKQITLDSFIQDRGIDRVDLIKIDTDGYELDVLRGAADLLRRFRPLVIFELTAYLMKERQISFSDYEELLLPLGYQLLDAKSFGKVAESNIEKLIPPGGGIDILAIPKVGKLSPN
jgi:FkbM family methyltransferase